MAVTTRGPIDSFTDVVTAPSTLQTWSQDDLDTYLYSWTLLTKAERRSSRALPPLYVRTPKGIFNVRSAEHVHLPDPPPDPDELNLRQELRIKKTRV